MPTGCSMNILMKAMPDRAFDVGIAEGHAVTFSGGMVKRDYCLSVTFTPRSCNGHTTILSTT